MTLAEGEYVIDFNYPLAIAINICATFLHLSNTRRWANIKARIRRPLYLATLVLDLLIVLILLLAFVVNERRSSPAIRAIGYNLVITIVTLHVIIKTLICIMVTARSAMIVLEPKLRKAVVGLNVVLSIATLVTCVYLIKVHIDFSILRFAKNPAHMDYYFPLAYWNMAQLALFFINIVGTTLFVMWYVGRNLVEREGYLAYLKQSATVRVGMVCPN